MFDNLLRAKITPPPIRPNTIPRPALKKMLDGATQRDLTLIVAPAGYGKSTLVSHWAADDVNIGWVSLDHADNDFGRFFSYLCASLASIDPQLAQTAISLIQSQPDKAIQLGPALLCNAPIDPTAPPLLVLDDYHLISNPAIHQLATTLVEKWPGRLLLISRAVPPLPLARWRARQQMSQWSAENLRFNSAETETLLHQNGFDQFSSQDINALASSTEGWAAGLQLALLRLGAATDKQHAIQQFTGQDRHVADYLFEEVFVQLPPQWQTFLMQTSILTRFSAELATAITKMEGVQTTIEAIEQHGLFLIPLDHERGWYRYHHLFGDFLLTQLHRSQQDVANLHRIAADWFAERTATTPTTAFEAIDHAKKTEDDQFLLDTLERTTTLVLSFGHDAYLVKWTQSLTLEKLLTRPTLALRLGWAHLVTGRRVDSERIVADIGLDGSNEALGEWHALKSHIAYSYNDFETAKAESENALALLSADHPILRASVNFNLARIAFFQDGQTARAAALLADAMRSLEAVRYFALWAIVADLLLTVLGRAGDLQTAETTAKHALALTAPPELQQFRARFLAQLGKLYYDQNNLPAAEKALLEARTEARRYQNIASFVGSSMTLARCRSEEAANTLLHEAADFAVGYSAEQSRINAWHIWSGVEHAWLISQIDWNSVHEINGSLGKFADFYQGIFQARWLIVGSARRPRAAISRINTLLGMAQRSGQKSSQIELLITLAQAHLLIDNRHDAQATLRRALDLAAVTGHVRLFLDGGRAVQKMLQTGGDIAQHPFAKRILNQPVLQTGVPNAIPPQREPLTQREREILQLLAQGHSNPEISRQLEMKVSTVRWHVKNIYNKLNVNNRTRATLQARALGLIS